MQKVFLPLFLLFVSFFHLSDIRSQDQDVIQQVYQHIESKYHLPYEAVGDLQIANQYTSKHNQVDHLYLAQQYQGQVIFGTGINIAVHPSLGMQSTAHQLKDLRTVKVTGYPSTVTATDAVTHAASALGITMRAAPVMNTLKPDGRMMFDKADISLQDIPVAYGYMIDHNDMLIPVYSVQIESGKHGKYFQTIINATDGQVIANDNLTLQCHFEEGYMAHPASCVDDHQTVTPAMSPLPGVAAQYHVVPPPYESPNHGPFQLISGTEDPAASPFGWHDTDGDPAAEFTYTRGNNVHAFVDRNWDYSPDMNVNGGASLIFNFPYDDNAEPVNNQQVSATNLFYWNNVMHDFAHGYGFDEAAGNFQEHNYTGEGEDGDYVEAQAQFGDNNHFDCGQQANEDVPCVNNAYFTAPPDGQTGRMVMFAWNRDNNSKYLEVLQPAEISGLVLTGTAQFGPTISNTPVTGEVVIINDEGFNPTMGCYPVLGQPELAGKIALIDRGVCDFSLKVYNAQEAGAIGAIVVNFEDVIITMGNGEQAGDVFIPSVFVSSVDGEKLRAAAGNGLVVTIVAPDISGPVEKDGALDNGIVSHEYAHGISIRLTGGPSSINCLTPNGFIGLAEESYGMGEGWSDFFAMALTTRPGDTGETRRGIGTFASREEPQGRGIRSYPYSTDMTINPLTYNAILQESMPHGVGAVWCAMIWDLYWALSDTYGWDPDAYHGTGGNNLAIQLVMDGLKLQGCNPGFIEARDAILMADMINNGGANQCIIWNVFARRGLGEDAAGGDPDSRSDGREGFKVPTTCLEDVVITKHMTPQIKAGEEIEVTLTVTNYKNFALTNVFIEDPVPSGCTYLPGSASIEPSVGNTLVWSLSGLDPDETVTITYRLSTDVNQYSIKTYFDDMEVDVAKRWLVDFDENLYILNFWYPQDSVVYSGTSAFRVGDPPVASQHYLENIVPFEVDGENPVYRFYTYYNTETGSDGGYVEIITEDNDRYRVDDLIFRNNYPGKLSYNTIAIPNLGAYSGKSNDEKTMEPVYIDLKSFAGQQVKVRYVFGSNNGNGGEGWYIDDAELMDAIIYKAEACVTSDQTVSVCAEASGRGTIVDSEFFNHTSDPNATVAMTIAPNPADAFLQVNIDSKISGPAMASIYDLTGKQLLHQSISLHQGFNTFQIGLKGIMSGMYVVQIRTSETLWSEKFIKE